MKRHTKNKTIVVRMSAELYANLSYYADYHGITVSEFVRLVLYEASQGVSNGITSLDRLRSLFPDK